MMADRLFTEEEMVIDEGLGYPRAYAKLCRDRSMGPYSYGPPFTFTPYALPQNEVHRAKEFEEMFPIIDPKANPTAKPKIFVSLLWKQLNHLGNAGFDPATFRVDPYGNVLYYHADSASPLAWEIDHWFPCSRGGLTVPSNLRILQWQVCKKKNNNLEFLVPWWDLQLGVSINQFLSVFASSNSDFRHRAFSLLFADGESEELNDSQAVVSHNFPHHFIESKERIGLAPAAIVLSTRESYESSSTLKSLDMNRSPRPSSPIIAARKMRMSSSKENENPNTITNPYQALVMARDSLRHKEDNKKMQAEINKLDDEMNELQKRTEDEKLAIQELELVLTKRKRRAEKCRRLAESQSSYRAMLEKMIRDAMHQSVIYKEQVRLNQAAANALKARLEAQKAICESSEKDLYRKFKQRDELESQIMPERNHHQMRKRSRMDDREERENEVVLSLPSNQTSTYSERGSSSKACLHKELRAYFEEEQRRAYEEKLSRIEEEEESEKIGNLMKTGEYDKIYNVRLPVFEEVEIEEENEESRKKRGKGNVEKWLQMLLEDTPENIENYEESKAEEIMKNLNNNKYPEKENGVLAHGESVGKDGKIEDLNFGRKVERKMLMRKSPYTIEEKGKMKESDENADEITEELNIEHRNNEIMKTEQKLKIRTPPYKIDDKAKGNEMGSNEKGKMKESDENADEITEELNIEHRNNEIMKTEQKLKIRTPPYKIDDKAKGNEMGSNVSKGIGRRNSFEGEKLKEKKGLVRSESFRLLRRIPSSPSMILGMKKGVDYFIRRKSSVGKIDDDDAAKKNNFLKTFKKAVKMRHI